MLALEVIVPSWRYWKEPMKPQPLWELYYATLIDERMPGVSVHVTDMRHPDMAGGYSEIPESDIYLYWVMKTADAPEVYDIVTQLKQLYPASVHIGGGTHIDNSPEESRGIFDAQISGTGEELLIAAITDHENGKLKSVYDTSMGFPFTNYSFARRHYLPHTTIVNDQHFAQYGGVAGTTVYFSRGCSFKCNFCIYNWPPAFEMRTPGQIGDEIRYLKSEYKVGAVNVRDEVCIPVNKKIAVGYLEAIGAEDVMWRGQTVPIASEELIVLAKESGCVELAIGLESVESDAVLEMANAKKNPGVESSRKFIHLLKKHGIKVKICLIFGLPGESKNVLENTIQFIEDTQPDYVALSGFDPVPGSTFYENKEYYGIKEVTSDLSRHAHLLYRFGDDEDVGLPFEYEKETRWGKALTRDEIIHNMQSMQHYLAERAMSY